jgi:hypothetical protein
MFPGEFILLTVIAVMAFHIVTLHRRLARIERHRLAPAEAAPPAASAEELQGLKGRIHVLERIATERDNSVATEIEDLRDR